MVVFDDLNHGTSLSLIILISMSNIKFLLSRGEHEKRFTISVTGLMPV